MLPDAFSFAGPVKALCVRVRVYVKERRCVWTLQGAADLCGSEVSFSDESTLWFGSF